jgi:uncharacterized RmlC-like cupin family protein
LPPGGTSPAHQHDEHESAACVMSGEAVLWFGAHLEHDVVAGLGDFLYIPDGVPHVVVNPSDTEPAVAALARTDPARTGERDGAARTRRARRRLTWRSNARSSASASPCPRR